eukprot:TRINITY_DN16582_c0_g1_i3.p1 TRINITY_DN16582_c0_g1~~TRINITY_DN16582_c0_g1_i3.p1  ORF type:complete len:557 (+),score=111.82 TRINITY_DN16582_c0_g1_i3:579-2249(+)
MGTVLTQGTVCAGAALLASGTASGAAGAFGVMAALPLVPLHYKGGKGSLAESVFKLDPRTRSGFSKVWLGAGEWLSLPPTQFRVERWGSAMRSMLPRRSQVIAADVALGQLAGLVAGAAGTSCTGCAIGGLADAGAACCFVILVLLLRPYTRAMRLPFVVLSQCLVAGGASMQALGYMGSDCAAGARPSGGAAPALLTAAGGVMLIGTLVDISAAARAAHLGRRAALNRALAAFASLDKDHSGELDAQELREGLTRLYKRKFEDDEFQALFDKVDRDGSGAVDIQEFLESEHLFWDPNAAPPSSPQRPVRPRKRQKQKGSPLAAPGITVQHPDLPKFEPLTPALTRDGTESFSLATSGRAGSLRRSQRPLRKGQRRIPSQSSPTAGELRRASRVSGAADQRRASRVSWGRGARTDADSDAGLTSPPSRSNTMARGPSSWRAQRRRPADSTSDLSNSLMRAGAGSRPDLLDESRAFSGIPVVEESLDDETQLLSPGHRPGVLPDVAGDVTSSMSTSGVPGRGRSGRGHARQQAQLSRPGSPVSSPRSQALRRGRGKH